MRHAPIDKQLFIDNRRKFADRLKPKSIAVFTANDVMPTSADGVLPFSQQTDLFYLSGIDQEETLLILYPDAPEEKHREVLFLRETNAETAVWEGQKYTRAEATAISGIETVCWAKEFDALFRPLAVQADTIYLNTNEHPRADTSVETREMRLLKDCRAAFPLHAYRRSAPIMHFLRAIKSSIEVDMIKEAVAITASAFERLLGFVKPGVWEFEIEAELHHEFLRRRSRGPAFQSIVASGADACTLHYVKNDKQCRDGDLVLMDFGAEYAHYSSDVTRTIPVNGRFTERQKAVYDAVLKVQKGAIDLLRPGNSFDELNREVGRRMEAALIDLGVLKAREVKKQPKDDPLYKKFFPHGVSHHLGLDVHDYGDRYRKFEPGMVLTCEPGLYIPAEGIGVRIENDILVTDGDPVDLTAAIPREPEEIEALMRKDA